MEVRGRRSREMSPERVKMSPQTKVIRPTFKRVQVVYYLSRNGQLEHPHYMEVTHLANQHLRLKDVTDRLTVLRGKGMPSLYSWSCKRSYKNGYVWNDLGENDIIYPSEGAEYVLKGSEIVEGCTEKVQQIQLRSIQFQQQLQLGNTQRVPLHQHHQITNLHSKPKPHQLENNQYEDDIDDQNKEIEYEKKISYTDTTMLPNPSIHNPRCSRGVSTDELDPTKQQQQPPNSLTEFAITDSSPPSTTSSTVSDKGSNGISKRYEDGDPVGTEPLLSRSSMLFQLIACGGSLSFRKTVPVEKQQPPQQVVAAAATATATTCSTVGRKSNCNVLHKGVLCKSAGAGVKVLMEEEEDEIRCMSENPRFGGNMQVCEEKEYFSGSIVEAMGAEERAQLVEPCLKKSNSYNEERCPKSAFVEAAEEEILGESAAKSKCIPKKKSSSKQIKK